MKKILLIYILTSVIANFTLAKLSIEIPEKMYASVKEVPILHETKQVSNKVVERDKQVVTYFLDYLYSKNPYIKHKISGMVNSAIEPNENIIYSFLMIYPESAGYDYYILTDKKLINAAGTFQKMPFVRRNGSAERPCRFWQVNRFLIAPRLHFSNGVEAVLR